jgi:hypothetical protein
VLATGRRADMGREVRTGIATGAGSARLTNSIGGRAGGAGCERDFSSIGGRAGGAGCERDFNSIGGRAGGNDVGGRRGSMRATEWAGAALTVRGLRTAGLEMLSWRGVEEVTWVGVGGERRVTCGSGSAGVVGFDCGFAIAGATGGDSGKGFCEIAGFAIAGATGGVSGKGSCDVTVVGESSRNSDTGW